MIPANVSLERHVLGCIAEDQNFYRAARERGLDLDCFSTEIHKRIFSAMLALEKENTPFDFFVVCDRCGNDPDVIVTLTDAQNGAVLEFSYLVCHVQLLKKSARLRKLQHVGEWLQAQAEEPGANPELLARSAVSAIGEVTA